MRTANPETTHQAIYSVDSAPPWRRWQLGLLPALLLGVACAGGSSVDDGADDGAPERAPERNAEPPSDPSYAAPQAVGRDEAIALWEQSMRLDAYELAAARQLGDAEREAILAALVERGTDATSVRFDGSNVWVDDVAIDAGPMLDALAGVQLKGKVLNERLLYEVGTQEADSTSPSDIVAAMAQYAQQDDGDFSFDRPEVSGFSTFLVVPDNTPSGIRTLLTEAVAAIGNASANDCLAANYLQIRTYTEFQRGSPFDAPKRAIVVKYEPDPCGGVRGCAQFPRLQRVALSPPSPNPGGGGGVTQNRFLFGGYVALDSNQVTTADPDNARSTMIHELMHTLGVAHPRQEPHDDELTFAAKLVVPGTDEDNDGYFSIMAPFGGPDRTDLLAPEDIDVINTLYNRDVDPGCSYQTLSIPIPAR